MARNGGEPARAAQAFAGGTGSAARAEVAIAPKVGNSERRLELTMEPQIKASLVTLLEGIKRSDGTVIAGEMERLDGYLARGRADGTLHPQLEHFLQNRSYPKALMFLGGEANIPAGTCGGRKAKA